MRWPWQKDTIGDPTDDNDFTNGDIAALKCLEQAGKEFVNSMEKLYNPNRKYQTALSDIARRQRLNNFAANHALAEKLGINYPKTELSYVERGAAVNWEYTNGVLDEAKIRGINETLDPAKPGGADNFNSIIDQLVSVAPDEFEVERQGVK